MRRLSLFIATALLLGLLRSAEAGRHASTLEVKGISVEFLSDGRVRVRGAMRCSGFKVKYYRRYSSAVDVTIDFPNGARGFRVLADGWEGLGDTIEGRRDDHRSGRRAHHEYEGRRYPEGQKKVVFYHPNNTMRPPLFEKELREHTDDGRWLAFDKTLSYKALSQVKSLQYRVVVRWNKSYGWGSFNHDFLYAVYGPFDWGEAPTYSGVLRSTWRRPGAFTAKGITIKKAVGEPLPKSDVQADEKKDDKKRPKPKRPKKRPNQLAGFEAGERLEKTLTAWPEIDRLGSASNPVVARLTMHLAPRIVAEAIMPLVARAAVEAAYEFTWVQTLAFTVKGDHGTSTVSIPWDATASFAAKESEPKDFFATWKVTGSKIPPPPDSSAKGK